jgi:ABC-type transport system substrate-binding protein
VAAAAGLGVVPSLLAACTAAPAAQGGPSGAAPASGGKTISATIVLPGQFVESMNPYAHSVSGIYPTWKHVMEPLVEFDFDTKAIRGVLAESWSGRPT